MWVRGLKHWVRILLMLLNLVAPHVGAWIETLWKQQSEEWAVSHPMWVRGLKPW